MFPETPREKEQVRAIGRSVLRESISRMFGPYVAEVAATIWEDKWPQAISDVGELYRDLRGLVRMHYLNGLVDVLYSSDVDEDMGRQITRKLEIARKEALARFASEYPDTNPQAPSVISLEQTEGDAAASGASGRSAGTT